MKLQAKAGAQFAALDDETAGEGLAIFFSQGLADIDRWKIEVYAKLSTGQELLVGFFFVSPPSATTPKGPPTRQVAAAVCPGAKSWSVVVSPVVGSQAASTETADITLISSKCCTAPVGVTRVNERYIYRAGSAIPGPVALTIEAGKTIKSWSAIAAGTGAGSIQLGTGNTIPLPNGDSVSADPNIQLPDTDTLTFTNVDYFVEMLESA